MKIMWSILVLAILSISSNAKAELLFSYDFESWGGTIATTSDYFSGSGYAANCTIHKDATEVVSSYDGLDPNSGSYFFIHANSDYQLSPTVTGITDPAVNAQTQIGVGPTSVCDTSNSFTMDAGDNIRYAEMYFAGGGWENVTTVGGFKLIAFYDSGGGYPILYIVRNAGNGDPELAINANSSYTYGSTYPNLFNGEWHKVALYFNYTTGYIAAWIDVENPTLENVSLEATKGTHAGSVVMKISENWSSQNPTGATWAAFDDIEVWDSLPTAAVSTSTAGGNWSTTP